MTYVNGTPPDGAATLGFDRQAAESFLDGLFGVRYGYAVVALGHDGYLDGGRYAHKSWGEHAYRWPAERELLLGDVAREMAVGQVDVYVCPALRVTPKRSKGNAVHHDVAWADRDAAEPLDLALVADLGAVMVVSSGTPGHEHVYVKLADDPGPEVREQVCRALAATVGACDPKWADNDLLRLPGTVNHKHGAPVLVRHTRGGALGSAVLVGLLDACRGVVSVESVNVNTTLTTPLHPPATVREALAKDSGDRSADMYGVVGACYRARYTLDETKAIVRQHPGGVAKYGKNLSAEVERAWSKVVDDGQREARGGQRPPPDAVSLLGGVRSGQWLQDQLFDPLRYTVPGVLPEGMTLLVGAPKIGKSWLTLAIGLAVARGGVALGQRVDQRPVLLLALEDGDRRMQDRSRILLDGESIPAELEYVTRVAPDRVVDLIGEWLTEYGREAPLVVVDTLGRCMPIALPGETTYQRDYRIGVRLKALSDAHPGTSLVVNHHDRKADADDFVDRVSGTHGLAGSADSTLVLTRRRNDKAGLLQVTGRDVLEGEYALTFAGGRWGLDGKDLAEAAQRARTARLIDTLGDRSSAIVSVVNSHPEGIRAEKVAESVDLEPKATRDYLGRLASTKKISRFERGVYGPTGTGRRPPYLKPV